MMGKQTKRYYDVAMSFKTPKYSINSIKSLNGASKIAGHSFK